MEDWQEDREGEADEANFAVELFFFCERARAEAATASEE